MKDRDLCPGNQSVSVHFSKRKLAAILLALPALLALIVVSRCSEFEFGREPGSSANETSSQSAARGASRTDVAAWLESGDVEDGNRVALLLDGPETYEAMLEAIATASDHIHLETYIIENDEVGYRIADALIERARNNVDVRLIYDGYGSTDDADYWGRLRDAGVRVHQFNPPDPLENIELDSYHRRDHRKILVVDGEVGFTGGVNFYDAYRARPGGSEEKGHKSLLPWVDSSKDRKGWRDTHIQIEGPAVAELQRIFVAHWERLEAETVAGDRIFPQLQQMGEERVRFDVGVGGNEAPSEIYTAYLASFREARHRIWITQAYFVPNDEFLDALKEAALRGIDVKVIVPGVTDVTFILYASRALYGELLEAGVQIFEFQEGVLHAKTAVIDGVWSTVGSSNLDYLSFLRNHEADAVVIGAGFAADMERVFQQDLERSRHITLEDWQRRPLGYKILGWMAGRVKPWL
jgi:cardiolipin synthase